MENTEKFEESERERIRQENNEERNTLGLGVAYDPEEADEMGAFRDEAAEETQSVKP